MDRGVQESLTAIPEVEQLVIPAKAGIQELFGHPFWIPAFAGMTNRRVWLPFVAFRIPAVVGSSIVFKHR
jgi:hypothetical protein